MTAFLAYSYSTNLSDNEVVVIDKEVLENREKTIILLIFRIEKYC